MMVFPMCGISIVNISPDYRNLLYRLRSLGDEKEISVMTKQGVIKPGNSQQILIEISNEQVCSKYLTLYALNSNSFIASRDSGRSKDHTAIR